MGSIHPNHLRRPRSTRSERPSPGKVITVLLLSMVLAMTMVGNAALAKDDSSPVTADGSDQTATDANPGGTIGGGSSSTGDDPASTDDEAASTSDGTSTTTPATPGDNTQDTSGSATGITPSGSADEALTQLGIGSLIPMGDPSGQGISGGGLLSQSDGDDFGTMDGDVEGTELTGNAALPSYSLLDPNSDGDTSDSIVTPVKNQNPWGTCWGFAAIAASETSVLSDLGVSDAEYAAAHGEHLDFSERALAWFMQTTIQDEDFSQNGEGLLPYNTSILQNNQINYGGTPAFGTTLFSAGMGPIYEEDAPYKNNEGAYVEVTPDGWMREYSEGGEVSYPPYAPYYNDELKDACLYRYKGTPQEEVYPFKQYLAGSPYVATTGTVPYQKYYDWSVDQSLRFKSAYELENTAMLPSPSSTDSSGAYRYDQNATANIKSEIADGRAVTVSYNSSSNYYNDATGAHYTSDQVSSSHAVTIVGWDDTYSADNFNVAPPGNGAWLVKNSWGAGTSEGHNRGNWGIDFDGDGLGDGFFWLSYYDKSLDKLETFDYMTDDTGISHYSAYAYDYMPAIDVGTATSSTEMKMANVYTADEDQAIRSVSTITAHQNTSVTYQIYLLNDGWQNPTDGRLIATVEGGPYQYAGFHREDLYGDYAYVRSGQQFSVVVAQSSEGTYEVYCNKSPKKELVDFSVEHGELTQAEAEKFSKVATAVVNPGESWMQDEGRWTDWKGSDLYNTLASTYVAPDGASMDFPGWAIDNFSIHAYGDEAQISDITSTTATDAEDGDHSAVADRSVTIDDEVAYADVNRGETYLLSGTLVDKATGEALTDAQGDAITATVEFTPDSDSGTATVTFTFDGTGLGGHTAVVFEDLYFVTGEAAHGNVLMDTHADLSDENQAVTLTEPTGTGTAGGKNDASSVPRTGDHDGLAMLAILVAAGAALVAASAARPRRRTTR